MRFVPLTLLNTSLSGALLLSIAGCGGRISAPLDTTATAPGTTANSAAPPGTSASTPVPPPSSSPTPTPPPQPPSSNGNPTPSPSPAPVPAGTTISNIEQMPGWESCDTCSGGGSIAFSMAQGVNSTQFSLGPGAAWAHALWWKRLGTDPSPSHFVLTLDQSMENPGASFGIEYEANQIVDGEWYDFAIQCSFGYGIWQLWDAANQQWVPTSVPCARPAPSSHMQLRLEFQRNNGRAVFVSIGTNGNIVPVNMAFNPQPISGLNGDFGVHIQLNANGNPDPYSVSVHGLMLSYW